MHIHLDLSERYLQSPITNLFMHVHLDLSERYLRSPITLAFS